MKTKIFGIFVTLMAAVALLSGCAREAEEGGAKKLVVGFDADFPPYGYKDGGEYVGFDLDLARAVCEKKGWVFVANPINWDAKDIELNSGAIDCIWNGFTIEGREEAYTFSAPYVDNSQVVLVAADSPIASLDDLVGKKVGVQIETPVHKAFAPGGSLRKLGSKFGELVIEPNYNQLVNELSMGAIDAVALDIGVAKKKMVDLPGKFKLLDEILMKETYGIGFKRGNTALRDEVEAALRELAAEGKLLSIADKYGIEHDAIIFK